MSLVLYKGEDWTWTGTCTNDDDGTRTDLTGKTVVLELRRRTTAPVLISLSIGAGATLQPQSGDTVGMVDFVITGAQSANLAARNHHIRVLVDGETALPPLKLPVRDP
ncbi:MAG: hypothetical protein EHM89_00185 [Acidobacteria bacterium]|nr:MAG: hypothetical protein EHM89_00185 [Acidobacteriota bacterium]